MEDTPIDGRSSKSCPSWTTRFLQGLANSWKVFLEVKVRPNPLAESPLTLLPPEIISLIANHLPTECTGAFAFSCRPINDILGRSHWDALHDPNQEAGKPREAFLFLLEKDMPSYIACQACQKLHTVNKANVSIEALIRDRPCLRRDGRNCTHQAIYETFHYPFFQMVMKRHRLGLENTDLLKLLSYNVTTPSNGHMHQCIAEARIVGNSLYVRVQHVFMIPQGQIVAFPRRLDVAICPHTGCVNTRWSNLKPLARILRCCISHWNTSQSEACPNCSGLHFCSSCSTDFQVDIKDFEKYGVALVLTKWKALGEGRDYNDPAWRNHLYIQGCNGCNTDSKAGSVCAAFEGSQPFRFDSLLPVVRPGEKRNRAVLFQKSSFPWLEDDDPNELPSGLSEAFRALTEGQRRSIALKYGLPMSALV